MISFKEYIVRQFKSWIFIILGGIIFLSGAIVMFITLSMLIGLVIMVMGGLIIAYGGYHVDKLSYEREGEGHRVYHYGGKFK